MADQPETTPEQAEIINLRHALNAATAEIDRLHDVTRSDDHTATFMAMRKALAALERREIDAAKSILREKCG